MTKVREGYKETEIGVIPEDWEVKYTENILKQEKGSLKIGPFGSQLKKEYLIESGYKVYGQENVFENDFKIGDRFINEDRFQKLKSCELLADDLIITMMGTIGKTAIIPRNIKAGIMDSHLIRLRANREICCNEFIRHSLTSRIIIKQIEKLSVGGIMAGLSSAIIKKLQFIIPPLQEQQRIAEILSTTDEHIEKLDKTIEDYQLLKKGMMKKLLTEGIGHTEFKDTEIGRIPKGWEVKKLKDIANIISGGTPKTNIEEYWVNGDIFWATPTDITSNGKYIDRTEKLITESGLKNSSANLLPVDTILMTSRATIGERCINSAPMAINQGFKAFVCRNNCYHEYLYYYINILKSELIKNSSGSTFMEISKSKVEVLKVSLPPIKEQKQIATILSELDNKIETFQNEREDVIQLKKGLMQKLLTGEIRVN